MENFLPNFPNYITKRKIKTSAKNRNVFIDYYDRLQEYVINMFEWKNLPDTVSERFIEMALCERGFLVYFNDEVLGNLALTCAIGGQLDVYRIPIYRRAYSPGGNGYQKDLSNKDSVLIYNNYLHTPSLLTIKLYAERLAEIDRAIDVNVKAQKTPTVILCDEKERLSMQNLYKDYDENATFILADSSINMNNITTLNVGAPFVAPQLNMLKRQIWQEALTFCGIENANTEKRERLTDDEVLSNLGSVAAQRYVMLNARREAANKINKMFGTNIEVNFRQDISVYNRTTDSTTSSGSMEDFAYDNNEM